MNDIFIRTMGVFIGLNIVGALWFIAISLSRIAGG